MKKEKVNILLIGNCSSAVGGSSLSFKRVYEKIILDENFNIIFINTDREKNNFLHNSQSLFKFFYKTIRYIYFIDIVAFNSDARAFKFLGPYIYLLSRIFNKKIVARVFGGSLDLYYLKSSFLSKFIFRNTIMKSNLVYLQTSLLINFFSFVNNSNILKLPTSRDKNLIKIERKKIASKFIYTGRLCVDKGIVDLIKAVEDIKIDITIDLYGSITDGISQTEIDLIKDLIKKSKNINYKGAVKNDEIYKVLVNYDVLILPSYWRGEGYPGSIIEAFHCELPVISTNWRSIPEIVNDKNGILVPIKSPELIRKAILEINNKPDLFNSLRLGAKESAIKFDESYWIKKYVDSIKNCT